ncbi:non-homologous end-joining DNA ligase [Pseudonocardia nigra]|uniref:non-homologous end-joining DNA ligase n=1 Tax=Pseudonocardia nigra TaxID=1921578 RepID=UPI001C600934|nr:non-homologous end-joining DNA ligase [Pseudonocardia nigra]
MLATPGALPDGPEWLFEVKWDGMRLLAEAVAGGVRLTSRSGRDVTSHFPELAELTRLAPDVLLDGEVVLLEGGIPSFAALADRMHGPVPPRIAHARPVTFMVFDVLRLYGVPLLERPLEERRGTLERLDLTAVPALSLSPTYTDGQALLDATVQRGMEGVVAKRRDSPYRPGCRSPAWVKVTHRRTQICLVGGWRAERSSAGRIGALLLGVPDGGGLRYAGKVGSGLAGEIAQRVLRDRLVTAEASPFTERVPRSDGVGAHWCEPSTVVEVAHMGWTDGGRLRQPVFRGVRDDLDPDQVGSES